MIFKGELILSLLENFSEKLNEEIDTIPKKTVALEKWMNEPIKDIFSIKKRSGTSFECEHAFFEIKMLIRSRYVNYFEMTAWRAKEWSGLLEIAKT
jgi:hypothetical protein